jgi:hypothetical protein
MLSISVNNTTVGQKRNIFLTYLLVVLQINRPNLSKCMLSIERVHAQMAEGGAEEVLLGAVLEQRGLQRSCCHLGYRQKFSSALFLLN